MRRLSWLLQDSRFAARCFNRERRFFLIAVFALALGISGTTILFSLVYSLLLDPYAAKNTGRWVVPAVHDLKQSGNESDDPWFSIPEYRAIRDESHVFEDIVGSYHAGVFFNDGGGARQLPGQYLTANSFDFFGVPALLGRGITLKDGEPGAAPVFAIGYNLWRSQFGGDPKVVGRSFVLQGKTRTLVGVMPPRFLAGGVPVWLPLNLSSPEAEAADQVFLYPLGRLKPGVTLSAAQADLDAIAKRLARVYPRDFPEHFSISVQWAAASLMGSFKQMLYALFVAVLMLLLIGCSNVANLLLARATARQKEIAIRAALGASRRRLIRQLLVESFLLAGAACVLGSLLAYGGLRVVAVTIPHDRISGEAVIGLNPVGLLFSLAVGAAAALACGLAPAVHAVRGTLSNKLASSGKGTADGLQHGKLRSGLVILEVALSLVLLVGAILVMRSFLEFTHANLGFNPARILYAQLAAPNGRYQTAEQKRVFLRKILDRVEALPGVTAAAEAVAQPPLWEWKVKLSVAGMTSSSPLEAMVDTCSEGYFTTFGLRLVRGRVFSLNEVDSGRRVAVVNEMFARKYFGTSDAAVGQQVKINAFDETPDAPHNAYFEVVGVVSDIRNQGMQNPSFPEAFVPYTVTGFDTPGSPIIFVRTALDPNSLVGTVQREVWGVDASVAVADAMSIQSFIDQNAYREPRFDLIMMGAFAGMGMALAMMGLFGVMSYTVSLQTHDIGVRMALGARQADILKLILRKGLTLTATGIIIGLIASFSLTRLLANQIWGISVADPWTYVTVVFLLIIVGASACLYPARRAVHIDPMVALRNE